MQSRKKILSMSISARALSGFASLILYSENEVLKPSNTGRLIADICEDTYAFQWHRTDRPAELESLFKSDKYQPVLVFPENYLVESNSVIEPKQIATLEKTPLFIFLDASWREARRIYRKSEYLQNIPCISISEKSISDYVMRKAIHEQQLATCEVAGIVLANSGFTEASSTLVEWFEVVTESYMLTKTQGTRDFTRPKLQGFID